MPTLHAVSKPKLTAIALFFRSPSIVFGTPTTEQRKPATAYSSCHWVLSAAGRSIYPNSGTQAQHT